MNDNKKSYNTGSLIGFIISVGIGFFFYLTLNKIRVVSNWIGYYTIVSNVNDRPI